MEGAQGAVLHTGDFRAESWFLDSLSKEPALQKYLAVPIVPPHNRAKRSSDAVSQSLEAIYLDTACLLGTHEVPNKVSYRCELRGSFLR